jgi:hypothetical protein
MFSKVSTINMNFENNRIVILQNPTAIQNVYGRYWSYMHRVVFAHMGVMRPRSGSYSDPWNSRLDPVMALPELKHIPDCLSDLFDQRALELFAKAKEENKRIYMMWSGGIDSTAVLVSFLRNLSNADLGILTVVLTQESIDENPNFYTQHIAGKLDTLDYYNFHLGEEFLSSNIVLTGDPGDCIFGPSVGMYAHLMHDKKHLKSFKDSANLIAFSIEKRSQNVIKQAQLQGFGLWYTKKVTENLLEVNPEGVETLADWWWWHYVNLKWETSIWRPLVRRKYNYLDQPLTEHTINNFVRNTFFNTDRFHQWSYTNLRTLVGNDIKNHKRGPKQYIFEFDKNTTYFENKTKMESVPARDNIANKPAYWNWQWQGQYLNPELEESIVETLEQYKG